MNFQQRDEELIRRQLEAQAAALAMQAQNAGNVGYSQQGLNNLANGTYVQNRVPELKATVKQETKRNVAPAPEPVDLEPIPSFVPNQPVNVDGLSGFMPTNPVNVSGLSGFVPNNPIDLGDMSNVLGNTPIQDYRPSYVTNKIPAVAPREKQTDKNYVVKRNRYDDLMKDANLANDIKTLAEVNYNNANQDATVSQEWADEYGAKNITGGYTKSQFIDTLSKKYGLSPKELNDMALTFHSDAINEANEQYGNELKSFGEKHPVLGSIASLIGTLGSGTEGAYNAVAGGITGDDRYLSDMFRTTKKGLREGVKENIDSDLGKGAYDIGMGVADMGAGAATGSAPAILAGNTANEAMNTAIDNGSSVRQAAAYGGAAGALDYITNKVGLEKAKNLAVEGIKSAGIKSFLAKNAIAGLGEAGENVLQDLGQTIADNLINGKNSELQLSYQDKVANGMSADDAIKAVAKEYAGQLGMSGATGLAMGSAMQAGSTVLPKLTGILNGKTDTGRTPEIDNAIRQAQEARTEMQKLQNQLPAVSESAPKSNNSLNILNNLDNRGGVDVPSLIEEARANMPVSARGEKTVTEIEKAARQAEAPKGLQGAELDEATAKMNDLQAQKAQKEAQLKAQKEAYNNAPKKNKNAEYKKQQTIQRELDAINKDLKAVDRSIKGEATPIKEQLDEKTYKAIYDTKTGQAAHINYAVKFAGDTPEAKQLGKEVKQALNNFVESGSNDDWFAFLEKATELDELAKATKADYTTKNGNTHSYDTYFGKEADAMGNEYDAGLVDFMDADDILHSVQALHNKTNAGLDNAGIVDYNNNAKGEQIYGSGQNTINGTGNRGSIEPGEPNTIGQTASGSVDEKRTYTRADGRTFNLRNVVDENTSRLMDDAGLNNFDLRDTSNNREDFSKQLAEAKEANPKGRMVSNQSPEALEGSKIYTDPSGTCGVAIKPDGDIVGVHKHPRNTTPKAVDDLLITARANGGDRLDCYGAGLVNKYERDGFIPVARVEWNEKFKPDDWGDNPPEEVFVMMKDSRTNEQVLEDIKNGTSKFSEPQDLEQLPYFTIAEYGDDAYDAALKYRDDLLNKQPTSEGAFSNAENKAANLPIISEAPRSDKVGESRVGTNTMVNSEVYTKKQIDNDPIISELNKYAKANNELTFETAKENVIKNYNTLLAEYTSGKRAINNDLDVDQSMLILRELTNRIASGEKGLDAQKNLLFSRLRQAGTLYGQTIQAFKKWNNTADGAIINGERILQEPVSRWKSQNKTKTETNAKIAKALTEMGTDSSVRNRPKTVKTHEQIKQGVKNVIAKEFGSVEQYFNDNDLEFLTTLAENKDIPVWKITDEIEHKLNTGDWYTLDESIEPKYPVNQKLKNALDSLVAQEPTVKEPPTLDEIKNEVRTTLDKEAAGLGKEPFNDDDVDYLASLIQNGATKEELSDALNTKLATGKFGITPETQKNVNDLFAYADKFDPNSKKALDLRTAAYKLIADEVSVKASPLEKFDSWRYLAMLGNPKTMIRNYVGNKIFGTVTGASNNLSAIMEAGLNKLTKGGIQRTKAVLNPIADRSLIKAAGNDAEAHRYSELNGTKYERGTKDAIKQQKSAFNSRLIRLYEMATDKGISDYNAVKKKYSTSLAGYMKANGLDESAFDADSKYRDLKDKSRTQLLTDAEKAEMDKLKQTYDTLEKARDYAVKQAEYATFHEDNAFAKWLTQASNNAPGPLRMVTEGLVPFKKTPANILRSGFEYSPLNAIKSIADTGKLIYENTGSRKGNLEDTYTKRNPLTGKTKDVNKTLAADVLDDWSKTLTGSALVGLGYYLKNKGIINSSNKDEKWQDDLEGKQNYSININGKTYTLDWAAPAVMPLLMGAEISKIKDQNGLLDKQIYENIDDIVGTVNAILDPIFETSMLQGIKNTMETAANDIKYDEKGAIGGLLGSMAFNTATGYLTQGLPTISGQIARTVDNTRRSTDTLTDQSFLGSVEKQGRKLMNKIPGLSKKNTEYYDAYGRTQENSPFGNPLGNLAYQMLSPAYIRDVNTTEADKSARNTYYSLGNPDEAGKQKPIMDKGVFASWKSKVTSSGHKFTPEEMATYRKESGQANYAIRDALTKEDWFNNLDGEKQTEILKKANTLVDKIGKDKVGLLDSKSKDLEAYQEGGIPSLFDKWESDVAKNEIKDKTGLSANTNLSKEIEKDILNGDTELAQQKMDKAAQDKKDLDELNKKYGTEMRMSDYQEKGSKEEAEKYLQDRQAAQKAGIVNKDGQVQTKDYQDVIAKAGAENKQKMDSALPVLTGMGYKKSAQYTYATALKEIPSLTPQAFDKTYKQIDGADGSDPNQGISQKEMIAYLNKGNYTQNQAEQIWNAYGGHWKNKKGVEKKIKKTNKGWTGYY